MNEYIVAGQLIISACIGYGIADLLLVNPFKDYDDYKFRKTFYDFFHNVKLQINGEYPLELDRIVHEEYTQYRFDIPAGMTLAQVEEQKDAMEVYFSSRVDMSIHAKNLFIKVFKPNMKTLYPFDYKSCVKGTVPIIIGYDVTGQVVKTDLSRGEPHMLISGGTGSGKSTLLRAILVNLIIASRVELYLIDLKNGVELNLFRNCKAVKRFCRKKSEAEELLSDMRKEIDRRYDIFYKAGCKDIVSYNATHKPMPYQLLVIDEFAELMYEKKTMALVEELSALARACGCHICLASQRPDSKVLSGRIKANITNIIGLRTSTEINSRIIIDDVGLEKLRGKGHGLFKSSDIVEFQAPFISEEEAKELIKPYEEEKQIAPNYEHLII